MKENLYRVDLEFFDIKAKGVKFIYAKNSVEASLKFNKHIECDSSVGFKIVLVCKHKDIVR
jgi:hypothetical protein